MGQSTPKWDKEAMCSWKERARVIKDSEYLSDCAIIVLSSEGDDGGTTRKQVVFNCHRLFLESASPVFHQMLFQQEAWAAAAAAAASKTPAMTSGEIKPTIQIDDVSPSVVEAMLSYVYLDEVVPDCSSLEETLKLFKLAFDFSIHGLVDSLSGRIIGEMMGEDNNVLKIYKFVKNLVSNCGSEPVLNNILEKAIELICKNADRLVDKDLKLFLELPEDGLLEILKRDDLEISSELKLFEVLKRWGELRCEQQGLDPYQDGNLAQVLEHLTGEIRFPLMSPQEFNLHVGFSNCVLGMEDMLDMLLWFTVPFERRGATPAGRFKSIPRRRTCIQKVTLQAMVELASKLELQMWSAYSSSWSPPQVVVNNAAAAFTQFPQKRSETVDDMVVSSSSSNGNNKTKNLYGNRRRRKMKCGKSCWKLSLTFGGGKGKGTEPLFEMANALKALGMEGIDRKLTELHLDFPKLFSHWDGAVDVYKSYKVLKSSVQKSLNLSQLSLPYHITEQGFYLSFLAGCCKSLLHLHLNYYYYTEDGGLGNNGNKEPLDAEVGDRVKGIWAYLPESVKWVSVQFTRPDSFNGCTAIVAHFVWRYARPKKRVRVITVKQF